MSRAFGKNVDLSSMESQKCRNSIVVVFVWIKEAIKIVMRYEPKDESGTTCQYAFRKTVLHYRKALGVEALS